MTTRSDPWLELLCTTEGRIVEVRRCDLDGTLESGQTLRELVDSGSVDKVRQFVSRVADRDEAYDWEIDVLFDGAPVAFRFAGRRTDGGLWVVAARNRRRLFSLLERGWDGRDTVPVSPAVVEDADLYDELMRVNNELTNLHRQVAKQANTLERLNLRKNRLLGMAAHDIRNPVAAIHAYSELLESDLASTLEPDHLDFLRTIKSTSRFLLELVNDLLDLATIEAGELRLRTEDVDAVALVRDNVALNRVLALRKGLDVRFASGPRAAIVKADARKLHQVIDNLLANAIKFSSPDSVIDVRMRDDGGAVVVSVSNEGEGILPEDRERLFDPFQQGRRDEDRETSGSGLGLAICRRIVEGHGGRIWVESEPGRGAVFSFSIAKKEIEKVRPASGD